MKKKNIILTIFIIIFIISIAILITNNKENETNNLIKLSYKEVSEKIKNKDSFILVVSQSTCSHCATYKPKLINIAKEYDLDIYYIDYDKEDKAKNFLDEFDLDGATPTTIFIEKGKETSKLNRIAGDINEEKIENTFKKMGFIK